jgi:hypothetical protein
MRITMIEAEAIFYNNGCSYDLYGNETSLFEVLEVGPWHKGCDYDDCFIVFKHEDRTFWLQVIRTEANSSTYKFLCECPECQPVEVTNTLWEQKY